MTRWLRTASLLLVVLFLVPFQALASGNAIFRLETDESAVRAGDRFAVRVLVEPNGETLDTVRAYLQFPPTLLRVEDIAIGPLFPRTSPGNAVDNAAGSVSYGGFNLDAVVTSPGVFATVTFEALAPGTASVTVLDGSRLISNGEEKSRAGAHGSLTMALSSASQPSADQAGLAISSPSHPDEQQWYASNDLTLGWKPVPETANVRSVLVSFDQQPLGDPTEPVPASEASSKTYADVADGIWYFHARAELADGTLTPVSHFQVKIDATAPNLLAPAIGHQRYIEGELAVIEFGTTDDGSGIDRYEVSVNNGPFEERASPLVIADVKQGDYLIQVKAIDRGGNERFGKVDFRVYPPGTVLGPEDQSTPLEKQLARAVQQAKETKKDGGSSKLLITFVLAGVAYVAIMSAILLRLRKRKNL